jgi:hypothetical protein
MTLPEKEAGARRDIITIPAPCQEVASAMKIA